MNVDARKSGDRRDGGMAAGSKQVKGMSPELQAHIGRQVRAMFDEVADEPVPEHLLRLLKDLDQSGDN
jgi:Anti-sigma factor NepR